MVMERTAAERLWNFEDLPLSRYTLEGLKSAKYTRLTAIQRAALPHSLTGKDVLGAAKTGSGKTLAFVIPVRLPVSLPMHPVSISTPFTIFVLTCPWKDITWPSGEPQRPRQY